MLFDLHVHSAEGSPCASIKNEELVKAYKEKGFDGFVLTNHMSRWSMECHYKLGYPDFCKMLHDVYLEAKEHGDKIGLTVLFGQELKLDCTGGNDYLLYGVTYEQLLDYGDMMPWTPEKLKDASEKDGFLYYQAHPFRDHMRIVNPIYLYGVEVFNGGQGFEHPWEDQRNDIANLWADKYKLHKIAGSDCHEITHVGVAGVRFMSEIKDNNDFLTALKEDNYYLVEKAITAR